MIKRYKIRLETLSPVHIGAGEAYDPTQFMIGSDNKMYAFDRNSFIASLSEQKLAELSKLSLDSRNSIPVFRFFRDNFDKSKVKHRVLETSADLKAGYEKLCNTGSLNQSVINQFELKRTIYNPINSLPYIPGSSLKGSIKTFWMSENAKLKKVPTNPPLRINELEEQALGGSFSSDPFRFVKVSDLHPVVDENNTAALTEIQYAVMVPKKLDKEGNDSLTVALEVIKKGTVFEGIISLDDQKDLGDPKDLGNKKAQYDVNINSLCMASRGYYVKKFTDEAALIQKLKATPAGLPQRVNGKLFKGNFLVRLGHHSSAEFMTIDEHENIKISPPGVRPPLFGKTATTIWLASKAKKPSSRVRMLPFGWALIEFTEIIE